MTQDQVDVLDRLARCQQLLERIDNSLKHNQKLKCTFTVKNRTAFIAVHSMSGDCIYRTSFCYAASHIWRLDAHSRDTFKKALKRALKRIESFERFKKKAKETTHTSVTA